MSTYRVFIFTDVTAEGPSEALRLGLVDLLQRRPTRTAYAVAAPGAAHKALCAAIYGGVAEALPDPALCACPDCTEPVNAGWGVDGIGQPDQEHRQEGLCFACWDSGCTNESSRCVEED